MKIVRIISVSGADIQAVERADNTQGVAMKVHRKFLLVVTLVAAATTPAVGANDAARGRAERSYARRCSYPGFLRHMGPSDLARRRAAAFRSGPGEKPNAPERHS